MGIVRNLLKRDHRKAPVLPAPKRKDAPTPLMLLLPDAGGIATYQHNSFTSARAAEYFLDSTLRGHVPEGAVLFWAAAWQPSVNPDYGAAAEPLVLIRDVQKPVVYPFSFSDIDGAQDFVRHEMKRGLDLHQVMIYFAVPARIEVDFWGRSTVIPPTAPVRGFRVEEGDLIQDEEPYVPQPQMTLETEVSAPSLVDLPESLQEDSDRYLTEADIANVVGLMQEISGEVKKAAVHDGRATRFEPRQPGQAAASVARASMAVKVTGQLIDFPTASQRLRSRDGNATAWANIALAIDEGLDVYVARQVNMKLAWNRLSRALGDAIEARERKTNEDNWYNGTRALADAARTEANRQNAAVAGWTNAGNAMAEAVDERKKQIASMAFGNFTDGIREGLQAYTLRRAYIGGLWQTTGEVLATCAAVAQSRERMRRAWLNTSWTMEEAAYAFALEQKAHAMLSWRNATTAIAEGVDAKEHYEAALRLHWSNAGAFFVEVAVARKHYDMVVGAWGNVTFALQEAVGEKLRQERLASAWRATGDAMFAAVKAAIAKQAGLEAAWAALTENIVAAAFEFKHFRERSIVAWHNVGLAMNEVGDAYIARLKAKSAWRNACRALTEAVPVYERKMAAIAAWTSGSIAIKEAIVAEAKMRIAQAGLDKELMAEVDKTVKEAQKAVRLAKKNGKKAETPKLADVTIAANGNGNGNGNGHGNGHKDTGEVITDQPKLEELAAFMADPVVEELSTAAADAEAAFEPIAAETAFESVFGSARHDDEGDSADEDVSEETDGGSSPSSGRWEPREEPFRGFQSPPGRFYRREREDDAL